MQLSEVEHELSHHQQEYDKLAEQAKVASVRDVKLPTAAPRLMQSRARPHCPTIFIMSPASQGVRN